MISRGGKLPKDFGTTGLKNHLRQHPLVYSRYESLAQNVAKEREQQKQPQRPQHSNQQSQLTIMSSYRLAQRWDIDSDKAKTIHRRIGEMIAIDCQPCSIVEKSGFQRLVESLEPHYQIPNRKFFMDKILPEMYDRVVEKLKTLLQEANGVSFTSDIWTSDSNNDAFLSLTAHYIDKNFDRKKLTLHIRHFPGGHTSGRIAEAISEMIHTWGNLKVINFVTDNGANIVKAIRDMNYIRISCAAHNLHLCITGALKSQRILTEILAKGRSIVGHFNHSAKACDRLRELQSQLQIPQKKLIQDVSTRWNSTLHMLESLLEQQKALVLYSTEVKTLECLTQNQWNIAEKVIDILKICEDVSKQLCSLDATASMVGPLSQGLVKMIRDCTNESGIGTFKAELIASITKSFEPYIRDVDIGCCTVIDPRYKDSFFSPELASLHRDKLNQLLSSNTEVSGEKSSHDDEPSSKKIKTNVWDCLDKIAQTTSTLDSNSSTNDNELETYLRLPRIRTDPLQFWRDQSFRFPKLAELSRMLLAAPPTSVASEQMFSVAGNILSPKRNRLNPKNVERILFLHDNIPSLNFDY